MKIAFDTVVSELRTAGLGYALDAPNPICLPGLSMKAARCDPGEVPLRATCIGGAPDLPPGFRWPRRTATSGGRWLTFLAQISLGEVAAAGLRGFPPAGVLSFFLDVDAETGSRGLGDFDSLEVHYFPTEMPLVRTPRPKPLRDPNPAPCPELPASRVEFALVPTFCVTSGVRPEDLPAIGKAIDAAARARARPLHQFGGYPIEIQDGALQLAASLRGGCGRLPAGHPAATDWRQQAERWRLLLQLDTDPNAGLSIGFDEGRLYCCYEPPGPPFAKLWPVSDCS